jgi:hypothetical protein
MCMLDTTFSTMSNVNANILGYRHRGSQNLYISSLVLAPEKAPAPSLPKILLEQSVVAFMDAQARATLAGWDGTEGGDGGASGSGGPHPGGSGGAGGGGRSGGGSSPEMGKGKGKAKETSAREDISADYEERRIPGGVLNDANGINNPLQVRQSMVGFVSRADPGFERSSLLFGR